MSVSGYLQVYTAADGEASDPDTTPANFIDIGRAYEGSDPAITGSGRNDAAGRVVYGSAALAHRLEMVHIDELDSLEALEAAGLPVVVALRRPDNKFDIYKNVRVAVRYGPNIGAGNTQALFLWIFGAKHRFADLLEVRP